MLRCTILIKPYGNYSLLWCKSMYEFTINRFEFNNASPTKIGELKHGSTKVGENWPIVYVINNDDEAYVGETTSAARRTEQHLYNDDRKKLTEIRIISDDNFNKSVALDLESFLIRHMSSDGKYTLQNGNGGLQNHDYYNKPDYEAEFEAIWEALRKDGVVQKSISDIENSDLFKYSPYKSLGNDQKIAEIKIIEALSRHRHKAGRTTILVRGGAGTGKTILAIYLMKLLADIETNKLQENDELDEYDDNIETIYAADNITDIKKIGLVIPQKSLQSSLKDVFKTVRGLEPSMVLSTSEVVEDYISTGKKFDLLIVDEAHRLKCRDKGHLSYYPTFDNCNEKLKMDKMAGTELDWIIACSENQVLFRDELQTVRPCDIDTERFNKLVRPDEKNVLVEIPLSTQWRCLGGNDYIDYLKNILSDIPTSRKSIGNYDVKIYRDVDRMINDIKKKDTEVGLSRVVAGYAWKWVTKGKKKSNDKSVYDIEIQGNKYHKRISCHENGRYQPRHNESEEHEIREDYNDNIYVHRYDRLIKEP